MRTFGSVLVVLGLALALEFGAPAALSSLNAPSAAPVLTLFVSDAAADVDIDNPGILNGVGNGGSGGASRGGQGGDSGNGGHGGFSVANGSDTIIPDASTFVVIDDVTTGDVDGNTIQVDARGATRPVVVSVAGSFGDTGVDVFAPGGNAQAGNGGIDTTVADSSGGDSGNGGDGGNGSSRGGDGGAAPRTVVIPVTITDVTVP